jgi:hypothetical protein
VFEFDLANNGLTGNIERTIQFDLPGVFQFAVAADWLFADQDRQLG